MIRKARIVYTVTYLNEKGQRVAIPPQECTIVDAGTGLVTVNFRDEQGKAQETELTEGELAQYQQSKALKLLDE